jgi:hypothetical protein
MAHCVFLNEGPSLVYSPLQRTCRAAVLGPALTPGPRATARSESHPPLSPVDRASRPGLEPPEPAVHGSSPDSEKPGEPGFQSGEISRSFLWRPGVNAGPNTAARQAR